MSYLGPHTLIMPHLLHRLYRRSLRVGYLLGRSREKVGCNLPLWLILLIPWYSVSSMKKKLEKESLEDGD